MTECFDAKKHIIITGPRGAGKTTLRKQLADRIAGENKMHGIVTEAIPGEAVYMCKDDCGERVQIGIFDESGTGTENRMKVVKEGFTGFGAALLDELIQDSAEWFYIDEIGYLEAECDEYLAKLQEAFEKKRVLAVVREQNLTHLTELCGRQDTELIHLTIKGEERKDGRYK